MKSGSGIEAVGLIPNNNNGGRTYIIFLSVEEKDLLDLGRMVKRRNRDWHNFGGLGQSSKKRDGSAGN
jgi:hypothetical protein